MGCLAGSPPPPHPVIKFASSHFNLYTFGVRGTIRVNCLAQEHHLVTWPGLELKKECKFFPFLSKFQISSMGKSDNMLWFVSGILVLWTSHRYISCREIQRSCWSQVSINQIVMLKLSHANLYLRRRAERFRSESRLSRIVMTNPALLRR